MRCWWLAVEAIFKFIMTRQLAPRRFYDNVTNVAANEMFNVVRRSIAVSSERASSEIRR